MPEPELMPRDVVLTVGTSPVEVSAETSRQRQILVIVNTSAGGQNIAIAWGKDAVAGTGLVLKAGAVWTETIDSTYRPSNLRITACSDAAGGTLAVHERSG
jgi:hypothetical protein